VHAHPGFVKLSAAVASERLLLPDEGLMRRQFPVWLPGDLIAFCAARIAVFGGPKTFPRAINQWCSLVIFQCQKNTPSDLDCLRIE
jgi:hypothetical protein